MLPGANRVGVLTAPADSVIARNTCRRPGELPVDGHVVSWVGIDLLVAAIGARSAAAGQRTPGTDRAGIVMSLIAPTLQAFFT